MLKKYPVILMLLIVGISPLSLFAQESAFEPLYHPKSIKVHIAKRVFIKDKVVIDAPVGYRIQSPVVKVMINDRGPFLFMFDTGFTQTMISKELADSLGLEEVEQRANYVSTPNQVVKVFQSIYHVPKLEIGGLRLEDYAVVANSSFEDDADGLKEMKIQGVLSANAFYPLMYTIDYQNEQIIVEKSRFEKEQPDVYPLKAKGTTPMIEVKFDFDKLNKSITQPFVIDTGSNMYIHFDACQMPEFFDFMDKQQFYQYDIMQTEIASFAAPLYGRVTVTPKIIIESPIINFAKRACQMNEPHGLLGKRFFEQYKVTIDSYKRLIRMLPH